MRKGISRRDTRAMVSVSTAVIEADTGIPPGFHAPMHGAGEGSGGPRLVPRFGQLPILSVLVSPRRQARMESGVMSPVRGFASLGTFSMVIVRRAAAASTRMV